MDCLIFNETYWETAVLMSYFAVDLREALGATGGESLGFVAEQ